MHIDIDEIVELMRELLARAPTFCENSAVDQTLKEGRQKLIGDLTIRRYVLTGPEKKREIYFEITEKGIPQLLVRHTHTFIEEDEQYHADVKHLQKGTWLEKLIGFFEWEEIEKQPETDGMRLAEASSKIFDAARKLALAGTSYYEVREFPKSTRTDAGRIYTKGDLEIILARGERRGKRVIEAHFITIQYQHKERYRAIFDNDQSKVEVLDRKEVEWAHTLFAESERIYKKK